MVDVYVGSSRKLFRVYKKKFCDRIPRFERLLGGGAAIDLPNNTAEAFDILIEWVYTDNLRQLTCIRNANTADSVNLFTSWDTTDLYALAGFLDLTVLMDRAIDLTRHLDRQENILLGYTQIRYLYNRTHNSCMMRKYGMQVVLFCLRGDDDVDSLYFETQQLLDLLQIKDFAHDFIEYSRNLKADDPRGLPDCDYHMHGKDEECAAKNYSKRKGN